MAGHCHHKRATSADAFPAVAYAWFEAVPVVPEAIETPLVAEFVVVLTVDPVGAEVTAAATITVPVSAVASDW